MAFWGLGTYVFFSYVCHSRVGLGTRKFFRKIFGKKKFDLPENLKNFFFQKVDFWVLLSHIYQTQKVDNFDGVGSGLTWHGTCKKLFSWKKLRFLGTLTLQSGEYSKIISERMKGTTILVCPGDYIGYSQALYEIQLYMYNMYTWYM